MPESKATPFGIFIHRFKQRKTALIAGLFIILLVAVAVFAPLIAPYDPYQTNYSLSMMPPSAQHLAGTDLYGRDILSRIIYGARISLAVGFTSVLAGALAGVTLGLVSGFFGGFLDGLIMRTSDVLFAFPGILLAIAIVAILGPGLVNVVVAVSVFSMPTFARIVRGSTLALKESLYVRAAKSVGAKKEINVRSHHARHSERGDRIFHHAYRDFDNNCREPELSRPRGPTADT